MPARRVAQFAILEMCRVSSTDSAFTDMSSRPDTRWNNHIHFIEALSQTSLWQYNPAENGEKKKQFNSEEP